MSRVSVFGCTEWAREIYCCEKFNAESASGEAFLRPAKFLCRE